MPRIGNPALRQPHFIKEWREFRKLSQDDLAERLGVTKTPISNIENLTAGYTQDSLEAIAEVLGVHRVILLTRPPTKADAIPDIQPEPPETPTKRRKSR